MTIARNRDQATRDGDSPLLHYTRGEWIECANQRIETARRLSGPAQPEIARAWEHVRAIQEDSHD